MESMSVVEMDKALFQELGAEKEAGSLSNISTCETCEERQCKGDLGSP